MSSTSVRPYQAALPIVAAVWLIVTVVMVIGHYAVAHDASGEQGTVASSYLTTSDLVVIAGLSGLIAIAATLPGCTIVIASGVIPESDAFDMTLSESTLQTELAAQHHAIERLGQAFLAGMLIRITGTVALFLGSSYYMETSPTRIGIWVLGWHSVLLLTEVIALSRQIRVS